MWTRDRNSIARLILCSNLHSYSSMSQQLQLSNSNSNDQREEQSQQQQQHLPQHLQLQCIVLG